MEHCHGSPQGSQREGKEGPPADVLESARSERPQTEPSEVTDTTREMVFVDLGQKPDGSKGDKVIA